MDNPLANQPDLSRVFSALNGVLEDTSAAGMSIARCPYSNQPILSMLEDCGDEIDIDPQLAIQKFDAKALSDVLALADTLHGMPHYIVASDLSEESPEPNDIAIIVDFGSNSYVSMQDTDLRFDQMSLRNLLDASCEAIKDFGGPLHVQAVENGVVHTLEHEKSVLASTAAPLPDDLSDFIEDLEEACAVIDVHSNALGDMRTATLSILERCPLTGRQVRAVYGCRRLPAAQLHPH